METKLAVLRQRIQHRHHKKIGNLLKNKFSGIRSIDCNEPDIMDKNRGRYDGYISMTNIQFSHKDNKVLCNIFKHNIHMMKPNY